MSFQVELDSFAGPLDLLLYLIRRDEIDVHDIPVAHIAGEYLAILRELEELDIKLGGEFMVMASMLIELKSQMTLLRQRERDASARNELDPRYELVRQLLEYRSAKDGASALRELGEAQNRRHFHPTSPLEIPPEPVDRFKDLPSDYIQADLWDLVAAYGRLLNSLGTQHPLEIPYDDTPIEVYYQRLRDRIADGRVRFVDCLTGGVHELVGMFLALLELLKQQHVLAIQDTCCGEIWLEAGPGPQPFDDDEPTYGDDDDAPQADDPLPEADDELPPPPGDPSLN